VGQKPGNLGSGGESKKFSPGKGYKKKAACFYQTHKDNCPWSKKGDLWEGPQKKEKKS